MRAALVLTLAAWVLVTGGAGVARAAQEQDVQLQLDLKPALEDEKRLKGLLDEWGTAAFDVTYTARPELDPAAPGLVRVRLEGFTIAFNPAWYARYKALHDGLVTAPHGPAALSRAAAYARQGDERLKATFLDGAGRVLHADHVFNTRAPSHFPPVEQHLFPPGVLRALPDAPPSLLQVMPLPPGETPYVMVPARIVANVRRIRIGDMADRRWPIDLRDPMTAPPPPPPPPGPAGNKPGPGGSAAPPPGGAPGALPPAGSAAPALKPPKLP
ncbi:MAG: hypothetical protein VKQ33_09105 [Candidatus Sericytochromatia bacterium]|nr:hypothetical protein [Candidatus Sericytochromatia bacterium]